MNKIKIIWLLCSLCPLASLAQNPVSINLTNLNGLPSNTVYNILQDAKGFIWLGHDKGLSRYDGSNITTYNATTQRGKSVSNLLAFNNSVWCQDFSGNFYYTDLGILQKKEAFQTVGLYSPAGILNNKILSVINYDSLRSYNIKDNKKAITIAQQNTKQAVLHDTDFTYYFSDNALKRFNGARVEVIQKFDKPIPNFCFLLKIDTTFYAFNRNNYPLAYKISGATITPLSILKNDLQVQDLTLINNEIWISTTTGAYCFDKNMMPLYEGHCFFKENSITKIIKDRENNYWFGTLNDGVRIVADINVKLYKYGGESITALSPYKGSNVVLAGTSSNLIFSLNSKTGKYNTIINNELKGEIYSLFFDQSLNTIIACANIISFYVNETKQAEKSLGGKAFAKVNNDLYAVAYSGGVSLLPRQNKKLIIPAWLKKYITVVDSNTYLSQGYRGRAVLFDSITQTIYTATSQGLYYYNPQATGSLSYNRQPIYASSLAIINGNIYVGTFSDGLIKIEAGKSQLVNQKATTLQKVIYKLYAEGSYLWLTSDQLIQRYNTVNGSIVNYSAADGLPKAEIKDIIVKDSQVFVATSDGLVIFNSNKNAMNAIQPLLQLNKVVVNNMERSVDSIASLQTSENNIELFFSLLSFKENGAATISYKINNADWQTLPKGIRNIQLASLAPGAYKVQIKAYNEDGVTAQKNIDLSFTINTVFYKKIWFILLLTLIFLAGMFIYFKAKLKRQKNNSFLLAQKNKLEQELNKSMLASIKSQMNPHFLYNALNTVQSYIYTNDKENASLYLGKFSELTRTILDMSNKETVTIAEEVHALQLYLELEKLRFEDKLNYNFIIDNHIALETTNIPSMLIQPYIENAIKHGLMHKKGNWQLTINFTLINKSIQVNIRDNGVGRKASEAINKQRNKHHQSFATDANEKRLDILNKGLQKSISLQIIDHVNNQAAALGTEIIINIPINMHT